MINITNLKKCYGKYTAVDGLSLEIRDNETFGLLGLNGAGKSTTINVLCSLINKTSGKIEVNGMDLDTDSDKIKQILAVSPQETAVANNLTVKENLQLIADLYEIKDTTAVDKMIEKFNLAEKQSCRAKTLSGGQKRRLSLAMSLITNPKILILDEPTLGLDIKARKDLWNIITEYKQKSTVILTTHYLEEAVALCDRIGIMNKGHLVALGTADEIVSQTKAQNFEEAFLLLAGGENE